MLKIEKNNDGTIEVWLYDYNQGLSVRVCTPPDKLASTLPRDMLVMVRKLINEMNHLLPEEPVLTWVVEPAIGKGKMTMFHEPKGNHRQ